MADADERAKIIDAICARGYEMMAHRYESHSTPTSIDLKLTNFLVLETGLSSGVSRQQIPQMNAGRLLAA